MSDSGRLGQTRPDSARLRRGTLECHSGSLRERKTSPSDSFRFRHPSSAKPLTLGVGCQTLADSGRLRQTQAGDFRMPFWIPLRDKRLVLRILGSSDLRIFFGSSDSSDSLDCWFVGLSVCWFVGLLVCWFVVCCCLLRLIR